MSPKGVLQALFHNLFLFPPVPGGAWRCQQLQCPSQWLPQALAARSFQPSSCEVARGDRAAAARPARPPPLPAFAVMELPLQRGLWTCLAPCAADKGRRGSGEIPACTVRGWAALCFASSVLPPEHSPGSRERMGQTLQERKPSFPTGLRVGGFPDGYLLFLHQLCESNMSCSFCPCSFPSLLLIVY